MHPTNFLVDGTMQDAVEMLAKMAAYRRIVPQSYAEREKVANSDFLTSLGEHVKRNPIVAQSLLGTVAGAGIGGLGTAVRNIGKKEKDQKSVLGNATTGALAGAGLGAGLGAVTSGLGALRDASPNSGMEDVLAGKFRLGSKLFGVSPDAIKNNPDLMEQIREINAPRPWPERLVTGTLGAIGAVGNAAPWTTSLLPYVGAADAALHLPGVGLARIKPHQATGAIGDELMRHGIASTDAGKKLSEPLQEAISKGKHIGRDVNVAQHERNWLGKRWGLSPISPTTSGLPGSHLESISARDWLTRRHAANAPLDSNVLTVTERIRPTEKIEEQLTSNGARSKTTYEQPRMTGKPPVPVEIEKLHHMTAGERNELMRQAATNLAKTKPRYNNLMRLPFTNFTYKGMGSTLGAAGLRAAIYGALPALEYVGRSGISELGRQRSMQQIIDDLRKQDIVKEIPAK